MLLTARSRCLAARRSRVSQQRGLLGVAVSRPVISAGEETYPHSSGGAHVAMEWKGRRRRRERIEEWWGRGGTLTSNSSSVWAVLVAGLFLLLLAWPATTEALRLEFSSSDPGAAPLANVSLGPGWSYELDRLYDARSVDYLSLDASTGLVYVTQSVPCSVSDNAADDGALHTRVIARTSGYRTQGRMANYTLVPLGFRIGGSGCVSSRDSLPGVWKAPRLKLDPVHYVVVYSTVSSGGCIPPRVPIVSLMDYIPREMSACGVTVLDLSVSSDFVVQGHNLQLSSLLTRCFDSSHNEIAVQFHLKMHYSKHSSQVVPYRVIIHPSDHDASFQFRLSTAQRRVRRQTGKTAAPTFNATDYTAHVEEEQIPGIEVVTMRATDSDPLTDGGQITYSMSPSQDVRSATMFSIHPITGVVNTTKALDRETIQQHFFLVTARDNGVPPRTGTATLCIIVDDVNDHTPQFESSRYTINVTENNDDQSTVLTVRATDKDFGDNAALRYSIMNTGASLDFTIHPVDGIIMTTRRLDRERQAEYHLQVLAVDQGRKTQKTASAYVDIYVVDENDNSPEFSESSYTFNVSEGIDVRNRPIIARITATDRDEGSNADIRYTLSGNTFDTFTIDSLTGDLHIIKELEYDGVQGVQEFRFNVRAQDSGLTPKRASASVRIVVIDVNDNNPEFFQPSYQSSVMENANSNTNLIQILAMDIDAGNNSLLSYSIAGAPVGMPISIEPQTGWLHTTGVLDREQVSLYEFKVIATDSGVPPRSASTSVTIRVLDVNDNAPVFQSPVYYVTISEQEPVGSNVISVSATDADEGQNARITYKIIAGNVANMFQIQSIQGHGDITLREKLDAMKQDRYVLSVQAVDPGGNGNTVEVFINVTDTNKYQPEFRNLPYRIEVNESVPVGTTVFKVNATDTDRGENGRVTFSMDPGVSAFAIDPNTGYIITRHLLDRETQPAYTLTITARDNGKPPLSDTTDIDVTVMDINDNVPRFEEISYSGTVQEEVVLTGTSVLRIQARDDDKGMNGEIYYTFEGGNDGDGHFSIDRVQGIIRVAQRLDRETNPRYDLVAFAYDKGQPQQSSSVSITITVEDINDNPPIFKSRLITAHIPENSPIGSTVATISATDPDVGTNALVVYTLEGGQDVDSFELVGRRDDPAIIVTKIELDYELSKKQYQVILRASSGTLFSTAEVLIMVEDVNDNAPVLKNFTIIYNFPAEVLRTPLARVPARDPDESDMDKLSYNFISGNEAGLLHLNASTGVIGFDSRLNSDVPRNGTFLVRVSDGKNHVTATCRLYVRLVTEAMQQSSVTIRLKHMTKEAFLSPLFNFFIDALATILHVENFNIFVINVQDDTDVTDQILNVSVSVRHHSEMVQGSNRNVFFAPDLLMELIYLQRPLLANLSSLQVLPFDDNMCLREICINYKVCLSMLGYSEAVPFIFSDTMVFRPIHLSTGYRCACPVGFADKAAAQMCDIEVDLCYSHPCQHGGTCFQRESGYTCLCPSNYAGDNCEVDLSAKYDMLNCTQSLCASPSQCVPLIAGGFRCEGCPAGDHYDRFCRLTTRSFSSGSYLTFPTLKRRHRFIIQLSFATREKNGLLFYNGRFNEKHDFVALEVQDGQVVFSFNVGSNVTQVRPLLDGGVSDGMWHQVTVAYLNRTATVTVGENCDTGIAVKYGQRLGGYSCAAHNTQELPERCDDMFAKNCHRLLDLTGPLQVGGMPGQASDYQIQNTGFVGCIKDFYIDKVLLDLASAVAAIRTQPGCPAKGNHCGSSPCQHAGSCREGWNTFICDCGPNTGGKDCSHQMTGWDAPRKLSGNGYLSYSELLQPQVRLPWFNGLAFRTRASGGTLMQIVLNSQQVVIKLVDGYIHYIYGDSTERIFDLMRVNDGQWHYFESRWHQGRLQMFLDYGHMEKTVEMPSSVSDTTIQILYVGAGRQGNNPMGNYLQGCVKDVRVGNNEQAYLASPRETNTVKGCGSSDVCARSDCGRGKCVDTWETYTCICPHGTIGPGCQDICTNYNPCENWAPCHHPSEGETSYRCECGIRQRGQYCEVMLPQECPKAWWGFPVCGPCNCPVHLGFKADCNQSTGVCTCKDNHYRPEGSNICFPCNCYEQGSTGPSCHPVTGQCPCNPTVVGRRCDQCASRYAEINLSSHDCQVEYGACPRNYAEGVWWSRTEYETTRHEECPFKAVGDAKRHCTEVHGWQQPDLYNCTNVNFTLLQPTLEEVEAGSLTALLAKSAVEKLKDATNTTTPLFGRDIEITFRMVRGILLYENKQKGLDLTSQQYASFVRHLMIALSNVSKPELSAFWKQVAEKDGGAPQLLNLLELYVTNLASNMAITLSEAFDAVADNVVVGVDSMGKFNSTKQLPKFDNIPRQSSYEEDASIILPESLLIQTPETDSNQLVGQPSSSRAFIGYVVYKTVGDLMPLQHDATVRSTPDRPLDVNSAVFTIVIINNDKLVTGPLTQPVQVTLRMLQTSNRTSPQCVYWVRSDRGGGWSTQGCRVQDKYQKEDKHYVVCSCSHLSTFAVLMDVADSEYLAAGIVQMDVIAYVLFVLSLILLFVAFILLLLFKRLQSNWNSIHVNLIFVIFVTELSFLVGINRVKPELGCRLVSIALHYFYMASFSWLFVEILHMYRMLTEIRNINFGSMKFYYLVGYVIPGIIVGLAVGLYTEGYGNPQFCWLSTRDNFVWSFAGPVACGVALNIFTFILAVKASCREKVHVSDLNAVRLGLAGAILLLLLLTISFLLGLISVNYALPVLHYFFTIFIFLQGLLLFIFYIILSRKMRVHLKKHWYQCQGKPFDYDENLGGTRSTVLSRSALAYRHDSSDGGILNRVNMGISTTSTTSRSSKSSGFLKAEDYLRSTSSSTSGPGPTSPGHLPHTGIPPYGYDQPIEENTPAGEEVQRKQDSDSDSDASVGRVSLDLASSHSSDEEDYDPLWDRPLPRSKAVAQAQEQLEQRKKEREREKQAKNNNGTGGQWAGEGAGGELAAAPLQHPRLAAIQPPDVTLPAGRDYIVPPVRSDSLHATFEGMSSPSALQAPPEHRKVQVLTHNGSISSDTESNETSV